MRSKIFGEEDPPHTFLRRTTCLREPEPQIPVDVSTHLDVGIEFDAGVTLGLRKVFRFLHQFSTQPGPLNAGADADVFKKQMIVT